MKNKNCEICESNNEVRHYRGKKFLCGKHREQMRRFGKIRTKTLASRNDFVEKIDYWEMVIRGRDLKIKAVALIDRDDKDRIFERGSWCMDTGGYVMNGKYKGIKLHQFILGRKSGFEIDHLNGNKLDNRKINLAQVNHTQNMRNWAKNYKMRLIKSFQDHLAENKDPEEFFKEILK